MPGFQVRQTVAYERHSGLRKQILPRVDYVNIAL